jgi:NAD(P)-dependent dehydrogenase (short-subunit alcohol dehydrogenase family)
VKLFDLGGKVAIVTGASRGIGRAIAETFAEAGARVVVSSRKLAACEEVVAAIAAKGGEAVAASCNIGRREECEALVARAREAFGAVDVLVCNAAINPYFGPIAEIPDETFDKVMASNVRSNLWLASLVLPEMAARRDGVVLVVSSIAGLRGSPLLGAYAISKAADMQLVRNLAVEWGQHNIRVNAIAPGLIKTDFARALWENPELREITLKQTPLQRLGEPEDIAGAALFLAAPSGRFVTGTTLVVDGGVMIAGRL